MNALFEAVNREALARLRSLLAEWLPAGHLSGREYECGDIQGHPGRSFKVNVDTGKWADFAGDVKGGDPISLYAAIHNLTQGDAARGLGRIVGVEAASNGNHQSAGAPRSRGKQSAPPPKPLTLEEFAEAKQLPIAWLREEGLENFPDGSGVAIAYFLEDGSQHARLRKRASLGKNGWSWTGPVGVAPIAYGIWKLNEWRGRSNFLLIVEGETDTLTAWHNGYPAIGLPGASNIKCLEAAYVQGFDRIAVVSEPDPAGRKFPVAVGARLREVGYAGRIETLFMAPSGFKDPGALYLANPEGFREAFDALLREAEKNAQAGDAALRVAGIYSETETGLVREQADKKKGDVVATYPLTNFIARVVSDLERDDGTEEKAHAFEITARLGGRSATFNVSAAHFSGMRWATEHLGAEAVVYAGQGTADHARVAIQLLSGRPPRRTIYTHSGWRKIGDAWFYLHGAGAIGADGRVDGLEVELPPELSAFRLELSDDPLPAIRASMRMLDLAPDRISVPIYGAIWRSILGGADYSNLLYGPTGVFKTELAALIQSHFGARFDARHLPTSFTSTANTNELLAFTAKDAVLVVDELHPPASGNERESMFRDAARLLRAQGNSVGRGRMRTDGTLRPARPPRGTLVATGEELPRGQSIHARLLTSEVHAGDISAERLTVCQHDAAAGLYAQATAAFVRWLAPQFDEARTEFEKLRSELRSQVRHEHLRTADIRAQLTASYSILIRFLLDIGAIEEKETDRFKGRIGAGLEDAANAQSEYSRGAEPVGAFLRLLTSAIGAGRAHVADASGGEPQTRAASAGWRLVRIGAGVNEREEWQPQGDRIGWVDGDFLYLDRDGSYKAAQTMAVDGSNGIEVSASTLLRRLRDRGLLTEFDRNREVLTARKTIEGRRQDVVCLRASLLSLSPPQPDQPDQQQEDGRVAGRVSGRVNGSF